VFCVNRLSVSSNNFHGFGAMDYVSLVYPSAYVTITMYSFQSSFPRVSLSVFSSCQCLTQHANLCMYCCSSSMKHVCVKCNHCSSKQRLNSSILGSSNWILSHSLYLTEECVIIRFWKHQSSILSFETHKKMIQIHRALWSWLTLLKPRKLLCMHMCHRWAVGSCILNSKHKF
jgi:hypothetical protein